MTQNAPYPPSSPPAGTPPSSPQGPVVYYPLPPGWAAPRKGFIRRMFRTLFVLLFVLSVLLNIELGMLLLGSSGGLSTTVLQRGKSDDIVAVYTVSGVIMEDAASRFGEFYRTVRDTPRIKAVVVRIDSPGGGVSASDQIHQMIQSIRQDLKRPVVVSMGGLAASGGYYIAAPADEIYAEPTTMTGSIGVLAMWPVVKGLLEKHGIEPVVIRSSHAEVWKAREFSPVETPDPAVRREILKMLDATQERFEQVVREGRGSRLKAPKDAPPAATAPEAATQPAAPDPFNGKTYLTKEALALGLVDKQGYLTDAAEAAASRANLKSPKIVQYSHRPGMLESLLFGEIPGRGGGVSIRIDAEALDRLTAPRILMLWKPE